MLAHYTMAGLYPLSPGHPIEDELTTECQRGEGLDAGREHLGQEIDISSTVQEFKEVLEKFGISQRFAAKHILDQASQGNLSFLLDKGRTKRWNELSPRGRLPYSRMREWLDSRCQQMATMNAMRKSKVYRKSGPRETSVKREKFSMFQLTVLCRLYIEDQTPSIETRILVSDKLNLSVDRVSIWFQNQRARGFPARKLLDVHSTCPTMPSTTLSTFHSAASLDHQLCMNGCGKQTTGLNEQSVDLRQVRNRSTDSINDFSVNPVKINSIKHCTADGCRCSQNDTFCHESDEYHIWTHVVDKTVRDDNMSQGRIPPAHSQGMWHSKSRDQHVANSLVPDAQIRDGLSADRRLDKMDSHLEFNERGNNTNLWMPLEFNTKTDPNTVSFIEYNNNKRSSQLNVDMADSTSSSSSSSSSTMSNECKKSRKHLLPWLRILPLNSKQARKSQSESIDNTWTLENHHLLQPDDQPINLQVQLQKQDSQKS